MPLSGRIPYNRRLACECAGEECDTIELEPGSFDLQNNVQAITGSADQTVASTRAGSLEFNNTRTALEWEIADDAPETTFLTELRELINANIDVYARPLIANRTATFTERDGLRTYTQAPLKALLVKPILDEQFAEGWEPIRDIGDIRMEKRFVEFRYDGLGNVSGTVIKYSDRAKFGSFEERFVPGAIRLHSDVVANIMHDRSKPLVRTGAGLDIDDNKERMMATIRLPDTTHAREAKELIEARIIRGMSMEFIPEKENWEDKSRIIERALLTGIGLVDIPAYSESQLENRFYSKYKEFHKLEPIHTGRRKRL